MTPVPHIGDPMDIVCLMLLAVMYVTCHGFALLCERLQRLA